MGEERVRVAVRIRSLLPKEVLHKRRVCVQAAADSKQVIVGTDQLFPFDYVFGPTVSQTEVYESCVQPLVRSLLDGYNATVFCYGPTGSGKTYTLGGKNHEEEGGIIDRVAADVFTLLGERQSQEKMEFAVRVSYVELYMEELRDLLQLHNNTKGLHIRANDKGITVVVGAKEIEVTSAENLLSVVKEGNAWRHTGTTGVNESSSRSHAVLTILLSQSCHPNKSTSSISFLSKLCLVDLAGSERAGKTRNTGARFKESVFINTDLLALSKVIRALSDPSQKGSNTHIPYRDSKITRLLRDSLGGTAHTLVITCISPSHDNISETLCALQFATRARHIRNRPDETSDHTEASMYPLNWRSVEARVRELEEELHRLRQRLKGRDGDIERKRMESIAESEDGGGGFSCQMKKVNHEETARLCLLVREAADLLREISSTVPDLPVKQLLEDWQERWRALNHSHHIDGNGLTENREGHLDATVLQLRQKLSKCQEVLENGKQAMLKKNVELKQVKHLADKLHQEGKIQRQALQEEKERTQMQMEQLVDQQVLIDQLRSDIKGLRGETTGGSSDGRQSPAKKLHSGAQAFSLKRVMASFKVHNQLLQAKAEERDEVYSPFIKRQTEGKAREGEDRDEEEDGAGLRRSLNTARLRRQKKSGGTHRHTGLDQTPEEVMSKHHGHDSNWPEMDEALVLQRRTELQELEEDLKRREEVLQQLEACLQQKNKEEMKNLAPSHELLPMSLQLETLSEQLQGSKTDGTGATADQPEKKRCNQKEAQLSSHFW